MVIPRIFIRALENSNGVIDLSIMNVLNCYLLHFSLNLGI